MGRKAMLLTAEDVPQYIKPIAARLRPLQGKAYERFLREGHSFLEYPLGYTFILYGKNKVGGEIGFKKDAEKLIKWCRSWYADAEIVETVGWWNRYSNIRSAYSAGFRNYHIVRITDPVTLRFERDNFYRGGDL